MAVNPSRNNKFGGRSLVSDIAGVGNRAASTKRAMSAADIIKKQQETVAKAEAAAEETVNETVEDVATEAKTAETTVEEKPIEASKEPVKEAKEIKNAEKNTVNTKETPEKADEIPAKPETKASSSTPTVANETKVAAESVVTAVEAPAARKVVPTMEAPAANPVIPTVETPVTSQVAPTVIPTVEAPVASKVVPTVNPTMETPAPVQNLYEPSVPTQAAPNVTMPGTTYMEPAKEAPVNAASQTMDPRNSVEQVPNYNYQQPYGNPQYNYAPQTSPYNNGYGMNANANFYGNYQDPYAQNTPNNQFPQDIQNAELHKTTNFGIFEDYPDINVRLPIKTGGDREMLKKSILESGIADPIIVAPVNDVIRAFQAVQFPVPNYPSNVQFIIIAGQNRRSIAKELNIELPFIIKRGLTKEQMDAIGLDTNLLNRQFSAMKPSEQVYIVNRRRALFEQNNTRNIRGKLSEITGYEKTYIYQLLSLVNVKRELLTDFVDPGYISVSGITHLVSVPFSNQELLYDYLIRYNIKKLMASQMKSLLQDSTTEWNDTYLNQVLFPNTKRLSNITLRPDQYQNLIPEADLPKATEIIIQALKEYYKK